MTGTVARVTAYQWYAGGQWRVMSPSCSTTSSPIPVGSVIIWIDTTSVERQFRF
jgi:hypothetical protein